MDKKNTMLLTVIAIATLLVAVVGATFAYFTATNENSADSEVRVQTKSVDTVSSSSTNVDLEILPEDMLLTDGANDYSKYKEGTFEIEMENNVGTGAGVNTCTYDLVYTPFADGVFVPSTPNTTPLNELVLLGTPTVTGTGGVSSVNTLAEVSLANVTNAAPLTLIDNATFAVTGVLNTETTATLTWDLTVRFYNLALDQSNNAGKTFGGNVTFENVSCVNPVETP